MRIGVLYLRLFGVVVHFNLLFSEKAGSYPCFWKDVLMNLNDHFVRTVELKI